MPTHYELLDRIKEMEYALAAAGIGAAAAYPLGVVSGRLAGPLAKAGAKLPFRLAGTAFQVGKTIAMRHPALTALGVAVVVYKNREQIQELLEQGFEIVEEGVPVVKRKLSKANKVVKAGMKWLKKEGKVNTGIPSGVLPANAFTIANRAAGMANPNTPSKIGKGKSVTKKLARVLKAKYYHGPGAAKYLATKKRPSL